MPKKPTGFEQMYPHIARWVTSYGWIEIGADLYSRSLVRAFAALQDLLHRKW